MLSSDPGLKRVEHLWHFYGSNDKVQALGAVVFPGRWPIMGESFWNKAMAAGKITLVEIGPYNHNLRQHYYDRVSLLPNGSTYLGHVVAEVRRLLVAKGLETGEREPEARPATPSPPAAG